VNRRENISIAGREVGRGRPCFIIAEVGVNHNGDYDTALKMVDVIAETSADCVKFQTFSADEFINDPNETYEYISQGKVVRESMLEMFRRLELKREAFAALFERARERGLIPLSTPTDRNAVDLLGELGAPAYKVGSDDLVYTQFLDYVARKGKPMIISSGMATATDVDRAVQTIQQAGNDQIVILHCVSLYPTPENEVNLRKIKTLRDRYGDLVGFSDHSLGITAALGAVALGACIVEKHFTLDRNMQGPDHRFSADPAELKSLVSEVRRLEKNLGSGHFQLSEAETKMAALAHRSIVLDRDVATGEEITVEHLSYRRPGTGLMPYESARVIGRRARKALPAGTMLDLTMVE
jgi:N,N'-diacetyllegionaminate synthase